MGRPVVQVSDLSKTYPGQVRPALQEISLEINRGEFVVLLGPSGVGKSTFLRCLNYLVQPTSGEVIVHGQRLGSLSRRELLHVRRRIGMIFQEFHLVGRMSVLTNVLCGRLGDLGPVRALTYRFRQEDYKTALEALRRSGLTDESLYLRRADTLSGGQKQRVAIARMLVQEPKVILADEPIASLDVKMSQVIMELINDIATKDELTVVMSLHNVQMAKRFATRIIGLAEGRLVFDGRPEDVGPGVIETVFGGGLPSPEEA